MTINERIKDIIKSSKELTQKGVADQLGLAPTTVNYWMKVNSPIPAEYVKPIADYLHVSCEFLLTGYEPAPAELSDEDKQWFNMIHQLPGDVKEMFKDEMEGYLLLHTKENTDP